MDRALRSAVPFLILVLVLSLAGMTTPVSGRNLEHVAFVVS